MKPKIKPIAEHEGLTAEAFFALITPPPEATPRTCVQPPLAFAVFTHPARAPPRRRRREKEKPPTPHTLGFEKAGTDNG